MLRSPPELSWGDSSLAGMCGGRGGGSCLVAVMGGCSLVLARDYSLFVVWVNSVVVGVLILSNGGVQALLSMWCEVRLY